MTPEDLKAFQALDVVYDQIMQDEAQDRARRAREEVFRNEGRHEVWSVVMLLAAVGVLFAGAARVWGVVVCGLLLLAIAVVEWTRTAR